LGVLCFLILYSFPSFASEGGGEELGNTLPIWSVLAFVMLLLSIALLPLFLGHWWENNKNKGIIAFILALPVAIFFLVKDYHYLTHTGLEYFSFIVLLGSLFTISGGIVLTGDIRATPLINTIFLAIGAVIANFIGTTGASMLLIRPMLRTNSQRKHIKHIPIFFIFLVSNIGGCLTPLGDPPLFLGYLRGVDFFWTFQLWPIWLFAVGIVLIIFYLYDRAAYSKEAPDDIIFDKTKVEPLKLSGIFNFVFLLGVILAIIGAGYMEKRHINPTPWREIAMIIMAVLAYAFTSKDLRERNKFTFNPIIEVAVLFAGIFVTMVPALLILRARGGESGVSQPWQFFWMTGGLSSFLDNAPTYLTYLSLAQGVTESMLKNGGGIDTVLVQGGEVLAMFLKAISAGAVFMGANTYIGNGPNFMVKSICEEAGIKMPSFFGYMLYSICILIPVFIFVTFIFFNPLGFALFGGR
jgi:Na+/H+ antiporter NhaD/arsenite permease-like protein